MIGVVFTYKGVRYLVLRLDADVLIQFEDAWHPTVTYCLADKPNDMDHEMRFVRSLPEFKAKFERE